MGTLAGFYVSARVFCHAVFTDKILPGKILSQDEKQLIYPETSGRLFYAGGSKITPPDS